MGDRWLMVEDVLALQVGREGWAIRGFSWRVVMGVVGVLVVCYTELLRLKGWTRHIHGLSKAFNSFVISVSRCSVIKLLLCYAWVHNPLCNTGYVRCHLALLTPNWGFLMISG